MTYPANRPRRSSGSRVLKYFEDIFPERAVAQRDPYRRAVESMLTCMETEFCTQGYTLVMNQSLERRNALQDAMLRQYARLKDGARPFRSLSL